MKLENLIYCIYKYIWKMLFFSCFVIKHLPVQSVPITTNVVILNPLRQGVLNLTLLVKVCQ